MLTLMVPSPSSSGQQFMRKGTSESSMFDWSDQRSTPTGRPTGKPLSLSLRVRTLRFSHSDLFTFGCTWKVRPGGGGAERFGAVLSESVTKMMALNAESSLAVTDSVPFKSRFSRAPSCDSWQLSFSSTRIVRGCFVTATSAISAATDCWAFLFDITRDADKFKLSSLATLSSNVDPFGFLPSFIDCTFVGAVAAMGACSLSVNVNS
mmetsp:Transcript_29110/g.93893  ORF Transcript_29110/g.93893 Transcript_29110/m.93893 type:complete len:207 (-) Transcript_29110:698-1318(-)